MANIGVFLRLALLCSVILRYSNKNFRLMLKFWKCLLLGLTIKYSYEHHAYHQIFSEEIILVALDCSMISAPNQTLTCHHWNISVTALYFRQARARPKHFLIETADEKAVEKPTSLNRQLHPIDELRCDNMCKKKPDHASCVAMCMSW